MCWGRKRFNLFRIPTHLDNLRDILSVWLFQLNFLSIVTPKKSKLATHSMLTLFIFINGISTLFCGIWNIINLYLVVFRESLFNLSHLSILHSSLFILPLRVSFCDLSLKALSVLQRVVSSAYIIKLKIVLAEGHLYRWWKERDLKLSLVALLFLCL